MYTPPGNLFEKRGYFGTFYTISFCVRRNTLAEVCLCPHLGDFHKKQYGYHTSYIVPMTVQLLTPTVTSSALMRTPGAYCFLSSLNYCLCLNPLNKTSHNERYHEIDQVTIFSSIAAQTNFSFILRQNRCLTVQFPK